MIGLVSGERGGVPAPRQLVGGSRAVSQIDVKMRFQQNFFADGCGYHAAGGGTIRYVGGDVQDAERGRWRRWDTIAETHHSETQPRE